MQISVRKLIGYAALIVGVLLLFDCVMSERVRDWPVFVPMRLNDELMLTLAVMATAGLLLFWAPTVGRVATSVTSVATSVAPGDDAKVEPGFESQTIESRRRERLPLKKRMSVLPDRSVLFGAPVMMMLIVTWWLTSPLPSRGVYVTSMAPPESSSQGPGSDAGVVVQVERRNHDWKQPPVYRVQGVEVKREELRDTLMSELSRRRPGVVYIYGEDTLAFQDVAYVIDAADSLQARPVLVGRKGSLTATK